MSDPLLERIVPVLAHIPGAVAVALGGSRATGAAYAASDDDIGLYFSERAELDVKRLLEAVNGLGDDPNSARLTEVGGLGPWIVGGGWLTIAGRKVDLLYRPVESVEKVCVFRSLACAAQALFAINRRYLINEKGAIAAAACLWLTFPIWPSGWSACGARSDLARLSRPWPSSGRSSANLRA